MGAFCELCVTKHEIAASGIHVGWILKPLENPAGRKPRMPWWVLPYMSADSLLDQTLYTIDLLIWSLLAFFKRFVEPTVLNSKRYMY